MLGNVAHLTMKRTGKQTHVKKKEKKNGNSGEEENIGLDIEGCEKRKQRGILSYTNIKHDWLLHCIY